MKKRILSGAQPSGTLHLGNYLGALKNHVEMQKEYECFIFLADLHALTTVRDAAKLRQFTLSLAMDYLALGIDPEKTVFFRQSDVYQHTELAWIFSCVTPISLLERAHAYKDAVAKNMKDATAGLFTYPVLMAADILLYQPDIVPVGKDQKQHVEIARDIGGKFNDTFGQVFKLPEPYIPEDAGYVIGTDGEHKMSKSYGNVIEIFADEALLQKQIMGIKTDSTPLEAPKDPYKDIVYKLYSYLGTKKEQEALAKKYKAGGFGYGEAKKILLAKILDYFGQARKKRFELQKNLGYVENALQEGSKKAKKMAEITMKRVKEKAGLLL